jgi:hypothetical protein
MHVPQDSMQREILKSFLFFYATKQGLYICYGLNNIRTHFHEYIVFAVSMQL